MDLYKLSNAVGECERFLKAAKEVGKRLEKNKTHVSYCKESAACRRASLDLSRALAELRKP